MSPKINWSKVKTLTVESTGSSFVVTVTYLSGQRRGYTFGADEQQALDALAAKAVAAGFEIATLPNIEPDDNLAAYEQDEAEAMATSPEALVQMLGLTNNQALYLQGADRLNFWRNGCLNVQIEHGNRATKFKLPDAAVTDADLENFFAGWGWKQLGQKPYFKPTAASLVQL